MWICDLHVLNNILHAWRQLSIAKQQRLKHLSLDDQILHCAQSSLICVTKSKKNSTFQFMERIKPLYLNTQGDNNLWQELSASHDPICMNSASVWLAHSFWLLWLCPVIWCHRAMNKEMRGCTAVWKVGKWNRCQCDYVFPYEPPQTVTKEQGLNFYGDSFWPAF